MRHGPGPGILRPPRGGQDNGRAEAGRLSVFNAFGRDRKERSVPNENRHWRNAMNRNALSRRSVLRGLGTVMALPLLDSMVSRAVAAGVSSTTAPAAGAAGAAAALAPRRM